MFRCGRILIALALLMATPVAVFAQTTGNPSAAQPAGQQPPNAELLMPGQLEAAGTVYEKDIGTRTDGIAKRIHLFDPDQTWKKVDAAAP